MAKQKTYILSCFLVVIIIATFADCKKNQYSKQLVIVEHNLSKMLLNATDLIKSLEKIIEDKTITEPCDKGNGNASGYLGCYVDRPERILSTRLPDNNQNTGDSCKQRCMAAGYKYAGTEYSVQCFCDNIIKKYPKGTGCTTKCPGNPNEMCGGTWYISIYDTGLNLPSGFIGCYIDKSDRILSRQMPNSQSNTGDNCKQQCKEAGYTLAGTENANQCFCGNFMKDYPTAQGCTAKCTGDPNERCGGYWRISIYNTGLYMPLGFVGCYVDKPVRILSTRLADNQQNTGDSCKQRCKTAGYRYAGTQYSVQCFCGNEIKDYPKGTGCTTKCPGNKNEICGGTWHISIYDTKVQPSFKYVGCYIDRPVRALSTRMPDNQQNTGESCVQTCIDAGYTYAGTEYRTQCFCGNVFKDYGIGTGCTATCPGNPNEKCGGTWHLSLYEIGRTNYCQKYGAACPANWVCENVKDGFVCRLP